MKKAFFVLALLGLAGFYYRHQAAPSADREVSEASAVEEAQPETVTGATVEAKALTPVLKPEPLPKEVEETLSPQEREEQQSFQVNTAAVFEEMTVLENIPFPDEPEVAAAEASPLPE